jgi:1-acyl-sn-glycerol-3-phosphate acyltransferase
LFVVIIVSFLARSYFYHLFLRDVTARRKAFADNTTFFAGIIIKAFGIRVNVINRPRDEKPFLLVSNHMGFIDILMIAAQFPALFITSNEMRETPFLGTLTEMAGCIYVERRSRTKIVDELKNVVDVLKAGFRVTLYPEATSTNGESVLPFKKTLMMAAAQAGVPIQPLVINFRRVNGEPFGLKWRDSLCWYGDITFIVSLWRALCLKSVDAEIEFLEQIHPSVEDDRGLIASQAHAVISAKFSPVIVPTHEEPMPADYGTEST